MIGKLRKAGVGIAVLFLLATRLTAEDSAEALLAEAEALYSGPESPVATLTEVRALLDRIVQEHPSSDLAVSVLLAEPVGNIDVALVNERLAIPKTGDVGAAERPSLEAPAASGTAKDNTDAAKDFQSTGGTVLQPGSEALEAALALNKQAIRDLQARLLVMGFDPNGVDGIMGRGTRSALRAWQETEGLSANGFLSQPQYQRLQAMSETGLAAWRADPQNERLYLPPAPIALGPRNMSGTWRFTSTCGASSKLGRMKITGVLNARHSGGNSYSGRVQQSQGFRGQFSGTLKGRQMSAEINWGLILGRVRIVGTVADQRLVMRGRDSNGCAFYAAKS